MLEAVTGADALVIVTEWGEFRSVASPAVRDAMATPFIVDGRNLLDPAQARAAGFLYESVGRAGAAEVAGVIAVAPGGGQGTRLRPLTEWLPKPMLPIANRPFLEHQVAHLRHHGVDPHRAGLRVHARRDPRPLRRLAGVRRRGPAAGHRRRHRLRGPRPRRDLRRLQRRHPHRPRPDRAGRLPPLAPGDRDDRAAAGRRPVAYGLVRTAERRRVEAFIEKPDRARWTSHDQRRHLRDGA